MVSRTIFGRSTYVSVLISPATRTRPVVSSVSQATRPSGSSARIASSTASEIWSASLSGCPSVTDSDVKRYRLLMSGGLYEVGSFTPSARPQPFGLGPGQGGLQPVADGGGQLRLLPRAERDVLTGGGEDRGPVRFGSESGPRPAHLVHHDQVQVLLPELPPGRPLEVVGLGGESHQDLPLLALAQ